MTATDKDPAVARQPDTRMSASAKADALLLQIGRLARAADKGSGLLLTGCLPDELRLQVLDAVNETLARAVDRDLGHQSAKCLGAETAGLDADVDACVFSSEVVSN